MKTKFLWIAALASAAMIAQANAGGHHGGGGGSSGGFAAPPAPAAHAGARGGASSFHGMPGQYSGPGRMMYGGRTMYSGRYYGTGRTYGGQAMYSGRYYVANRMVYSGQRYSSARNYGAVSRKSSPGYTNRSGNFAKSTNGTRQFRNGNNTLRPDWRNHVFAQHSANWNRNWDHNHDHWWHGHRCHFVNGSWFLFDYGFYPWWPYWYADDYYAYDSYYPNYYSPYYNGDQGYYNPNGYYDPNGYPSDPNGYSSDQYDGSIVAAVQEKLARQDYYHGEIDGVMGPETRRAIARYQRSHGLHANGDLTMETLEALRLRRG